jgi:ubiquinone/menaquinone biosynthesis C-methylase UbiE
MTSVNHRECLGTMIPQISPTQCRLLDIGGEGRNLRAWNLNPSRVKTIGRDAGHPIPRLIAGRAEAIPLPDSTVEQVIVERTPLRRAALNEIFRVLIPRGLIILRHARPPWSDPHTLAISVFGKPIQRRICHIGHQTLQESIFRRPAFANLSPDDPALR